MSPVASFPAHATRCPRWWLLVSIALVFVLPGVATAFSVVLMQTPSATVTLVLQAHTLTTSTTLHVVPGGHTDPTTNQLAGRVLPSLTMSEQQTVPTSGIVHQAA